MKLGRLNSTNGFYREAAALDPEIKQTLIESMPLGRRARRWLRRTASSIGRWFQRTSDIWIPFTVTVVAAATGFVFGLAAVTDSQRAKRPCEAFANTPRNELPARCIGYWEGRRP